MADAHASEACSRKGVEVQLLFPALVPHIVWIKNLDGRHLDEAPYQLLLFPMGKLDQEFYDIVASLRPLPPNTDAVDTPFNGHSNIYIEPIFQLNGKNVNTSKEGNRKIVISDPNSELR